MTPNRRAALIAVALLTSALTACGGSGSSGVGTPATGTPAPPAEPAQASADPAAGSTGLTPAGTRLAVAQDATVAWVPLGAFDLRKVQKGLPLQVSVVSIEKGSIDDFKNVQLNATESTATPYYVKVRVKATGSTAPTGDDDPDIAFQAIDDRGQQQSSVTFIGEFKRCADSKAPKPFAGGKSYQTCLAYLVPGGGSIREVRWNEGPSGAGEVTPYFSRPVVWSAP
ncbi:hypothetical protein [Streptomyces sp. SPB162]|uniref:hypothetical protein n=1 Tax=Streptomyces sp. SPB162 TaxID=2940560 RepID=UPI002405C96F|nr:hypothetical protein [Streptomyces sp. SPB162]